MKTTRVTGCVVTHNNIRSIEKTLESLLTYTRGVDFKLSSSTKFLDRRNARTGQGEVPCRPNYPKQGRTGASARGTTPYSGDSTPITTPSSTPISMIQERRVDSSGFLDANGDIGLASPKICFPDGRPQILGKRNPTRCATLPPAACAATANRAKSCANTPCSTRTGPNPSTSRTPRAAS